MTLHRTTTAGLLRALRRAERNFVSAAMISILAQPRGRIVTHAELIDGIYGNAVGPKWMRRNFGVLVHRMRREGVPIISHKGRGYSLERAA